MSSLKHTQRKKSLRPLRKVSGLLLSVSLLTACAPPAENSISETSQIQTTVQSDTRYQDMSNGKKGLSMEDYTVIPETFSLSVKKEDTFVTLSHPVSEKRTENFIQEGNETSWDYPDEKISVSIVPKDDYLSVSITSRSEADNDFSWPSLSGDTYYLPLGEGKRIPSDDPLWQEYLSDSEITVLERLSMPFLASVTGDNSVVVIMEDPYRTDLLCADQTPFTLTVNHQYPQIDSSRENKFRFYLTDQSPVSAAKLYQQYVAEEGRFVTLEEKAVKSPDVRKLYGAPFIYLWGEFLITPEDINWQAFRQKVTAPAGTYLTERFSSLDEGKEAAAVMEELPHQDYVAEYQKNTICRALSLVLKEKSFYDDSIFSSKDKTMESLINKGISTLSAPEIITLNKHALAAAWPDVVKPADTWNNGGTTDIIHSMKQAGISSAWIGLNSWEQAYAKPELVSSATDAGYLIGPYDSYHSIHEPGKEQWITASFPDTSLYENAAVKAADGSWLSGFKGVGRKLNPVLALPSVKQRVDEITKTGIPFNSWFIDCDATGEIYDDYSPGHLTAMEEDLQARLQRIRLIRDQYHMVTGSEGGNDYAAADLAFAHGIELQSFSWMDKDMSVNKESPYYMGAYYSPSGGAAERFIKPVPVKERLYNLFLNPIYEVPLYKLVYNRSMITSSHWDWSTLKIQGAEGQRMIREVLFNVPPLYHLDQQQWKQNQSVITSHTAVWSAFSKRAVMEEMTDFQYLTDDRMVQMTQYGDALMAVANYGTEEIQFDGHSIPGQSVLMKADGEFTVYQPKLPETQS